MFNIHIWFSQLTNLKEKQLKITELSSTHSKIDPQRRRFMQYIYILVNNRLIIGAAKG